MRIRILKLLLKKVRVNYKLLLLMKNYYVYATICIAAFGAVAAVNPMQRMLHYKESVTKVSSLSEENRQVSDLHGKVKQTPISKVKAHSPLKEEEEEPEWFTVTVKPSYDVNAYTDATLYLMNDEMTGFGSIGTYESEANMEVPAGTYDLVLTASKLLADGNTGELVYLVYPDIEVNGSCELTVNADEATDLYSFRSYLPNGEEMTLDEYRLVEDPDSEFGYDTELVKAGNISGLSVQTALCKDGKGWLVCSQSSVGGVIEGSGYQMAFLDVLMNPVPGWLPVQTRSYRPDETSCELITLIPEKHGPCTTDNLNGEYASLNMPTFQQTKYGASLEHQPEQTSPALSLMVMGKNFNPGQLLMVDYQTPMPTKIDFCIPKNSDNSAGWEANLSPSKLDAVVQWQADTIWFSEDMYMVEIESLNSMTEAPAVHLNAVKELSADGSLLTPFITNDFFLGLEAAAPWHPLLPTAQQAQELGYGVSQPCAATLFGRVGDEVFNSFSLVGTFGEMFGTYDDAIDFTMDYNGVETLNSNTVEDILWRYQDMTYNWFATNPAPGKIDYQFKTFPGEIDGLESVTEFSTGLDETKTEAAPLIQILNYNDADGKITNRFEKAEGAMLRIVGGKFKYDPEAADGTGAFRRDKSIMPTVEYAPYGTGDWKPLTMEERDVNMVVFDGYGFIYLGDLSNISEKANRGWFDLKVSMTDETGAYMTQTISPAFQVSDLASVGAIAVDAEVSVKGRNIVAPSDAEIYSMNGLKVSGLNVAPGIYVVRHGSKAVKVIVK